MTDFGSLQVVDADDSGDVDYEEFCAWFKNMDQVRVLNMMNFLLKMMDFVLKYDGICTKNDGFHQ